MSKILMAFLGTADYKPCNYLLNGYEPVNNVRFIQEALASLLCKDWTENDRIIIFLTEKAKNTNWIDNGGKEGLERRLKSLELKVNPIPKSVPEGRTETEIWTIFDEVFNQINTDDEIIFDITHGFRSLPMLAIVILNYAEVLKNIKIGGVYYGAFDAKDADNNAPIFNLTPLVHLFNWTNATRNFLTYGDAKDMCKLAYEEIKPILIDTQGKDETIKNLRWFNEQLGKFTQSILTCRGHAIIRDFEFDRLKKLAEPHKEGYIKPMNPLLGKIAKEIKNFNNNDPMNCYAAVKWCIDHNLTQQGYTFLREAMITEIVEKEFGMDKIIDKDARDIVETAINIKNKNLIDDSKKNKDDIVHIIDSLDSDFILRYNEISQRRNDINHAGFRESPMKPDDLIRDLEKYYEKLKRGAKDV